MAKQIHSFCWGSLVLLLPLLTTSAAHARDRSGPDVESEARVEPVVGESSLSPEVKPPTVHLAPKPAPAVSSATLAAYRVHARTQRRARIGRLVGFSVAASGLIAVGVAGLFESEALATVPLLSGGVLTSVIAANAMRSPQERTLREVLSSQVASSYDSDAFLRQQWAKQAKAAKTTRMFAGTTALVCGTAYTALGVVALSIEDLSGDYAAVSLVTGTALVSTGTALLLVPSAPERSWAEYQAGAGSSSPPSSMTLRVVPAHHGATLGLVTTF